MATESRAKPPAGALYEYRPDYAVHPGEYLEEVLEARGLKKGELADRLGISFKHLSQVVNRQAPLSAALAVQLELVLGVSAEIWNNLNADYELFQERQRSKAELETRQEWLSGFPVRDLKRLGFLPDTRDRGRLLSALLGFFEIPGPDQWGAFYGNLEATSFRKSPAFKSDLPHLAAWLKAGELQARAIGTKPYSKEAFKDALTQIRLLTAKRPEDFEPAMVELCAEAGLALAFVPELEKTHVSGAARWLSSEKALIVLSLRYKTNDHFWFTFFHEAGHILLHGRKDIFLDESEGFESQAEAEADRFARNLLIPEQDWRAFVAAASFDEADILAFAKTERIHPGIVVGRLQHEKRIAYQWHNELKQKLEFGR
ncbi:MAG TPA: HigA family addiction module antitoxin [Spirochaetales bacterium]|nr:HigA family addiction module antitoxin [Spirochaetales bacterium]HRY55089.1 HigA family addiction module antitoxin [Spirochaetia bacterium]HRZ64939.1 HigA family addiction module antitoxin [Spirochaetia bacterium]